MDEMACPRCRMTKYRDPSLRLKINVCGHALCEACVRLVFLRESAACPECHRIIKKKDFRLQQFEDTRVEKEVGIRKNVLKIYNKLPEDFPDLRSYNDYQEEIEDMIWSLENDLDTKAIRDRIEEYKQDNADLIRRNQIKRNKQKAEILEKIDKSNQEREERSKYYKKLDIDNTINRQKMQDELIEGLSKDYLDPDEVQQLHNRAKYGADYEKDRNFTDHHDEARKQQILDLPDEAYIYQIVVDEVFGPIFPTNIKQFTPQMCQSSVRNIHIRGGLAGGYTPDIACKRALQDAFSGLFSAATATSKSFQYST